MQKGKNVFRNNVLAAIIVAIAGYLILLSTDRTGLVDMSIEALLFLIGSIIAFKGFTASKGIVNKHFRKFVLFYGLTYLTVTISFIMGIWYFIKNPNVIEIEVADITGNHWLIMMSFVKSFSMIFLIFTWSYFYKYLNIAASRKKKIVVYLAGVLIYLGMSIIIWKMVGDMNVLSLGIIVGIVVGIFALIAQDKRTRYLTVIFMIYSMIHLIEFYMMGIGKSLTTGINNPIYWAVTVLYVLEVRRWIGMELNRK